MKPTDHTISLHFGTKIGIHGHLAHDFSPPGKTRWFIYQIVDIPCQLIYVGSTTSPTSRFATHKSQCNSEKSKGTGLSNHFREGNCPNDEGREKWTLEFTLVDFLDTTEEELHTAGHVSGPKCTCSVCDSLKRLEDKFILRTGSFYSNGLNSRNEITRKARCSW